MNNILSFHSGSCRWCFLCPPLNLISARKHNSQAKELPIFKISCMSRSEVVTYFILCFIKILFRPPTVFITKQRHVAKQSCCKEIKLRCGSPVAYLNQQRFDKCVVQFHVLVRCHVLRVVGNWDGECVACSKFNSLSQNFLPVR